MESAMGDQKSVYRASDVMRKMIYAVLNYLFCWMCMRKRDLSLLGRSRG